MPTSHNHPKQTDMTGLKELALTLLRFDIQTSKLSPIVVSHPFTGSGLVAIRKDDGGVEMADITSSQDALLAWREQIGRFIDNAKKPIDLMMMVTKPYKLGFLKYAMPSLSEQDAASLLSQAWIMTESPNTDPNLTKRELLSLFRSVDPQKLMDKEEYEVFCGLDDVVTVYRGVASHNAKNVRALSWTLSRDIAEWFAHRYGEQGAVYVAQIQKEYICAVFLGRGEEEVILDPKHLRNITTNII